MILDEEHRRRWPYGTALMARYSCPVYHSDVAWMARSKIQEQKSRIASGLPRFFIASTRKAIASFLPMA